MAKKRNFLYRLFTFSGYIGKGEFWSSMVSRLVSWFCAVVAMCIAVSVTVKGETGEIVDLCEHLAAVLAVLWAIPVVALTRRRLRDGGLSPKNYLWLLLPVIGWIVFIVRLCAPSMPPSKEDILELLK